MKNILKKQLDGLIDVYLVAKIYISLSPLGRKQMTKKNLSFQSHNLVVDWISFNIQGLPDPGTIASSLPKHFTPHVLIDDEPNMSYHGFKKSIRFLSGNVQDPKVTGWELRLFSLVKILLIVITLSKLRN